MRSYVTLAMLAVLVFAMNSCGKPKAVRELASKVEATNEKCPMHSDFGVLNSVEYDEENNVVRFFYEVNAEELGADLSVLRRNINLLHDKMLLFIVDPRTKGIVEDISSADATMVIVYKDTSASEELEMWFTPSELKNALANTLSDRERSAKLLEYEVNMGKANCPVEVDEVTTLVDVRDDGRNLIYSYSLDDREFDMSSLDYDGFKKSLLADTRRIPAMREVVRLLKENGRGLVYSYHGDNSGKNMEITFTTSEL